MHYRHTQTAPMGSLILVFGVVLAVIAFLSRATPAVYGLSGGAAICIFAAAAVNSLTVENLGDRLAVRFGPLPLLGTTIRYSDIRTVEAARSNLIDGWGVHWIPGRGTIYNLWGFDCVRFELRNGKCVRIGTDDVDALLAAVQERLRQQLGGDTN